MPGRIRLRSQADLGKGIWSPVPRHGVEVRGMARRLESVGRGETSVEGPELEESGKERWERIRRMRKLQ